MSSSNSLPEYCSLLSEFIHLSGQSGPIPATEALESQFSSLATQLFQLQFTHNNAYRMFCESTGVSPAQVKHWKDIPAIPSAAFKEMDLTCLPPNERPQVFHSSGTTEHRPSRHFHSPNSLRVYKESLVPSFKRHVLHGLRETLPIISLTPTPAKTPHSSLVHMFETVRREFGASDSLCAANVSFDGSWQLNHALVFQTLERFAAENRPVIILGTAFSYVHLLDQMASVGLQLRLPPQSRLMETGGYKGRSRAFSRNELHSLLQTRLGLPRTEIVSEYGMSELSSQAYDCIAGSSSAKPENRVFNFPPWARVQIISPETGAEVEVGQTGLIRVTDLANAYSVMAVQTEDLGIRHAAGFELMGRTPVAESRGCSLMPSA